MGGSWTTAIRARAWARRARAAIRLLQVRLRIPIALLLAALAVGWWDELRNRWDRMTRGAVAADATMRAVSSEVEFFCPMDPGVIAAWPGKCGVCHMALVSRKKGDASMLPDGVIARMQLSPYRVQLAGVLAVAADFRPLSRTHRAVGAIDRPDGRAVARCEVAARRAPWIAPGVAAAVDTEDLPGRGPWEGRVTTADRRVVDGLESFHIEVEVDDPDEALRPGMQAEAVLRIPAAELEPFRSQRADPPPRRPGDPVQVYVCPDHPDSIGLTPGRCPEDQTARAMRTLDDRRRVGWWCPMHPEVVADRPEATCAACGGMELRPRVLTFRPEGQVLAVPESAVVDTGERTVVFVESMPGTFDAVEVALGPRCGDDYPVVRGLEAGQKVVVSGAFLLDAETRLNPSLAAGYFGAARRRAEEAVTAVVAEKADAAPSPADREAARRQAVCPVTRKPLGSMGTPVRVEVDGRVVFLCCSGCEAKYRRDPAKYSGAAAP